ncbi:MAG: twin-arginine translocase TatA/TatE family subunit [Planctomycetales bacterium]|nr:twin-arginine translocase TatA/TatE family subunit [Planctomycetales bacterium]
MFSGLGYQEMMLFGIIALMLFGSKLPDMARKFGGTYRDLRKKVDEFHREFRDWDKIEPQPTKKLVEASDDENDTVQTSSPKFVPPRDDDS